METRDCFFFTVVGNMHPEGRAFVKLEDGFVRGTGFLGGLTVDTMYFRVGEQSFLWKIVEFSESSGAIRLKCKPVSDNSAPAPIRVIISKLEEGGRVTVSGRGVNFTGEFTKFE